jgi:hypothetical protein
VDNTDKLVLRPVVRKEKDGGVRRHFSGTRRDETRCA